MFEFLRQFYFKQHFLDFLQRGIFNKSIDNWLIVHFASGLILGLIIKKDKIALTLLIGYELFENLILAPQGLARPENLINITLDIIIGFIAYKIVRKTT